MKKDKLEETISNFNQHLLNLHNRLTQIEWIVSNYITMRKNDTKLRKYLDKKVEEENEKEKGNGQAPIQN